MGNKLFVIMPSSERDDLNAVVDPNQSAWETVECSLYGIVQSRKIGPLRISEIDPKHDVVWTWYSDILVNDRARRVLGPPLSGCSFLPVAFSDARLLRYSELRITGFAGFARADSVTVRTRCDECGIYSYDVSAPFAELVDMAKWDGSDIFTIWPFPKIQICTERAATVIRESLIDGISVIPIDEFESSGSAAPGRPQARLDDNAVRRLMNDVDFMTAIWPQ